MRKKKENISGIAPPAVQAGPTIDLDPIANNQLAIDVWQQLVERLNNTTASQIFNTAPPAPDDSGEGWIDRLSLEDPPATSIDRRMFGKNMRRLVKLVQRAILNPVYINLDVGQYYLDSVKGKKTTTKSNPTLDDSEIAKLRAAKKRRKTVKKLMNPSKENSEFPDITLGRYSQPLTVVDSKNRIVLWYLPGLLSDRQQSAVGQSTLNVSTLLRASVKLQMPGRDAVPNWRVYRNNFAEKTGGRICEPGAVTFSGGWFAQGHAGPEYPLKPSANLKPRDLHLGGGKWMESSGELEKFLNLTLSLIHPELFNSGRKMLERLRELDTTKAIADEWQSVYTGIQVISNRVTPIHRDTRGRPEWFDLLVSYSDGGSTPYFSVKDIGLDLKYSSGTVVGFCGTVFKHEVKAWGPGDRVCLAHFMREEVRERLAVDPAGWITQDVYTRHIPGGFPLTVDSDYVDIDS